MTGRWTSYRRDRWSFRQLITAAVYGWIVAAGPAFAQTPAPASVASAERVLVMPFENVAQDGRIFWLGEASAILLTEELNGLGRTVITREERQEAFERLQAPPAAVLTDATVLRLGQLVGATAVVQGTVRRQGEDLVIDAREITIDAARVRHRVTEHGPLGALFPIFERLARRMAPGSLPQSSTKRQRPSTAAFENYIKGLVAEDPRAAIAYLQAALDVQPMFDQARLALWGAQTKGGDHQAAAAAVETITGQSPVYRRSRFLQGLSYLELLDYDEAFAAFSTVSELQGSPAVFNNLGVVQLRRGATSSTGPPTLFFDTAAQMDPTDADLFFNLGYAYWRQRDAGAAIHWLREAVRRNPADGEAHYVLGTALASSGSTSEAAREKDLAKRLSSTFEEWDKRPLAEQVPANLERVKDDVALPAVRRAEDMTASGRDERVTATFYVDRGRRLFEQGMDRDAAAELSRALFLAPYHAEGNLLLGRVHQRAGHFSEAIGSYKIAIWSADSAAARAALASAYLDMKDGESARTEALRALELDRASTEARQVLERLAPSDR